jgi:hypothetical protein
VAYHVQEPNIIPSPGWTPARKTMRPNHRKIRAPGPRQHHRRGRQSHRRNIYQDSLAAKFFRLFVKSHGSDPSQESCKPYQTPAAETSTSRNSSASCKPHTRTRCRQTSRCASCGTWDTRARTAPTNRDQTTTTTQQAASAVDAGFACAARAEIITQRGIAPPQENRGCQSTNCGRGPARHRRDGTP